GYTRKQLLGMTVFDIDPNFNEERWPDHWEKLQKKTVLTIESMHKRKDGTTFPVEITVNYLEFNDRQYHCAHARNITHRRMAESALKESEEKFRMLSEQGILAIVIIQNGLIKYSNEATAELTEYSIDEMAAWGKNEFGKTVHPDDRAFVMEQAAKKQRGDSDVVNHYSYRMITKSGKEKWVDLYSKTVIYNGKNADFVSMVDITRRKETDDVLKKAHHELEFLVEERTVELTEANRLLKRRIFDLYTIFELSRNFNAVLNYETLLDSFVLTSLGQMGAAKAALYLPRQYEHKNFYIARMKGSPPFPGEENVINPDGEFGKYITAYNRPVYISDISRKMQADDGLFFIKYFENGLVVPLIFQTKLRGVLIISQKESGQRFQDEDIEFLSILANQTAVSIENARLYESEKEAIDKLQKTQKLLLQTERLAVAGELSAKIAHEVNNPLGIIKNYLQLLERHSQSPEKINEYTNIVGQEIDRIAMIVRQLLNINKPMRIKFVRTNPYQIIKEVLSLMNRQLENANIKTLVEVQEPLPEIMAWPDGIKQVFMNLLLNARDAIPNGGEVFIKISHETHKIQVVMEDTGPGIDAEHIPHIFEPFYSTKEGGGSGLGLSVSRGIITNHSGTIEFYNGKKGGCFKIVLPIDQEEDEYEWRI
ncbi:MAG: PAS domain S-box protein, partial [Candidatus Zixiibacteriota bacterium]